VEPLMANALRPRSAVPNTALCLAERARAFRARNDERCQTNQEYGGFRASLSGTITWRWAAAWAGGCCVFACCLIGASRAVDAGTPRYIRYTLTFLI